MNEIALKKSTQGLRLKTILVHRQPTVNYNVLYNGKDVTPKPINPEVYISSQERQISAVDMASTVGGDSISTDPASAFLSQSTARFKSQLQHQPAVGGTVASFFGSQLDDEANLLRSESSEPTDGSCISSVDWEEKELVQDVKKIPSHIHLVLNETNTFFVLDLPSSTALKDTEEGNAVEEENTHYEYLTAGKGRNRKVINAEVQTIPVLLKSRNTEAKPFKQKSNMALASTWDMFDTYAQGDDANSENSAAGASDKSDDGNSHVLSDVSSVESYRGTLDDKQLQKLAKNPRFLECACVIERILANNYYNQQQKRFRGLLEPDVFREDLQFQYRLNLLWTFSNNATKGRCVTSMDWNPANKDLLAVGYGKFYFKDVAKGMVMIWSIKNPVQPERRYDIEFPVTTLSFSKKNPNLLAVGLYNGNIYVLDVAEREMTIINQTPPSFESIWSVAWHMGEGQYKNTEEIYASVDDGRVFVYRLTNSKYLQTQQIMRTAKADGKLKGIVTMKKCTTINVPVSRYCAALLLRRHPLKKYHYFVGTDEGVIHLCSTNYINQHLDLFMAHDGPVNGMKFSPFCSQIFATCGDDWNIRIWGEGIHEPLLEMSQSMESVFGFDWSPVHSTILASITGKYIYLWDMQRKCYEPQSVTVNPTDAKCTLVSFVDSGRCLVVGDIEGNVQIFSLEDMPIPAFFQQSLLFESLRKALVIKPDVILKLKKLRTLA